MAKKQGFVLSYELIELAKKFTSKKLSLTTFKKTVYATERLGALFYHSAYSLLCL